ncbi:hypothetical protein AMS68_002344 [Peltaster fructicola]|uniref:BRCT domain-containing protein n=1 Tax=Peltaster fructicola TaxID=286661 RepID=A0A6H0XPY9_9PEZI|nr:hypothetical protein AMS68_002344 [Peltaster fructicola]
MVSTRGGAKTGPADGNVAPEADATMRKRSVRKTTAPSTTTSTQISSTAAASSQSSIRSRSTRVTTATTSSQITASQSTTRSKKNDSMDAASQHSSSTVAKPSTRVRSKKGHETPLEADSAPSQEQKTTRRTRANTQTTSQDANIPLSEQSTLSKAKSTVKRSRTTKTTSQALSPKKTTQMSNKLTRTASGTGAKKKTATESVQRAMVRTTRGKPKKDSDENAEHETIDDAQEEPAVTHTPPRSRRVVRPLKNQEPSPDSSMSTRSTTPSDSSMFQFSQPKDYVEDKADAAQLDEESEVDSVDEDEPKAALWGLSDDELAGPTTPMRRTVSQAATVDHAQNHAEHALDPPEPRSQAQEDNSIQHADVSEPVEESIVVFDDLSMLDAAGPIEDLVVIPASFKQVAPSHTPAEQSIVPDSFAQDDRHLLPIADTAQSQIEQDPPQLATSAPQAFGDTIDADETVLIEEDIDVDMMSSPQSSSSAHSVIVTRQDNPDNDAGDFDDDYTPLTVTAKTPRPQTINWNSIQPNTVVRANLQMPISPQVDESQLGVMPDVVLSSPTKQEIIARVERDADEVEDDVEFTEFVALQQVDEGSEAAPTAAQDTVAEEASPKVGQSPRPASRHTSHGKLGSEQECTMPHYMLPTIAFEARRNSIPDGGAHATSRPNSRPSTSDGADLRSARPFEEPWWTKARHISRPTTPADANIRQTSTPTTPADANSARRSLAPFTTSTPKTRASVIAATAQDKTTRDIDLRLSRRLAAHANTVAAATRYKDFYPNKSATVSKAHGQLRRFLDNAATPAKPQTPMRTPLRAIMTTPRFSAMTPHPSMPLRGVVAIVEVYTLEGASASAPFVALLHRLGAKTTKIWGDRVTHVVFKDGPPTTLQRVSLHNKSVDQNGTGTRIHCVNSRWVSDCDSQGTRVSETGEAYIVSAAEPPISAKRKRKSMEPSTVFNVDGSLVLSRKNSWGRTASGRFLGSPMPSDSPAETLKHSQTLSESLRKLGAARDSSASPATPAWIAAPNQLVQATAPLKRVRRLEPAGLDRLKARRRTMWNNE